MVLKKFVLIVLMLVFALSVLSVSVISQTHSTFQTSFGTFCALAECEGQESEGYLDVLNPTTCEYDLSQCVSGRANDIGSSQGLTRGNDCNYDLDCAILGCPVAQAMQIADVSCQHKFPEISSLLSEYWYDVPGICVYNFAGVQCGSNPICVTDTDCQDLYCENSLPNNPKYSSGTCLSGQCSYNPARDCRNPNYVECTEQTFATDCTTALSICSQKPSQLMGKCVVQEGKSKGYCQTDDRQCDVPSTTPQGTCLVPPCPTQRLVPPTTPPGPVPGPSPPGSSCQVVTNNPNVDLRTYEPKKGEFDNQIQANPWEFNFEGTSGFASSIDVDKQNIYLKPAIWSAQYSSFWTKPREAILSVCDGNKLNYPLDLVVSHFGGYTQFRRGSDNNKFLTLSRYCAQNKNDLDCIDSCSTNN